MDQIKVLVVDDMSIIIELIISLLNDLKEDFIYLKAYNGREACKIAVSENPNLIIMDWEMPQMSGIEALARLKKHERTNQIPVIIASAFSDSESVKTALEAGAMDYIRKPIDGIELIARVRSVLALSSSFEKLKQQQKTLDKERKKIESILKGILPEKIIDEIRQTGSSKPKRYKCASILFADLVNFTQKTTRMSPKRLINELNEIFSAIDHIISKNGCTRIKTIGDAYLAVAGIPEETKDHAIRIVKSALEIRDFLDQRNQINKIKWEIKIGIHSGDVIGSIVGHHNFLFDIFGDSVNTASRIQNSSEPMQICLSECTYKLVKDSFPVKEKGEQHLKGKGEVKLFYLDKQIGSSELEVPEVPHKGSLPFFK